MSITTLISQTTQKGDEWMVIDFCPRFQPLHINYEGATCVHSHSAQLIRYQGHITNASGANAPIMFYACANEVVLFHDDFETSVSTPDMLTML